MRELTVDGCAAAKTAIVQALSSGRGLDLGTISRIDYAGFQLLAAALAEAGRVGLALDFALAAEAGELSRRYALEAALGRRPPGGAP